MQALDTDEEVNPLGKKEIRDLDVSEEEGEDVKGGSVAEPGPMPPQKNPGKPALSTSPAVPPGVVVPKSGKYAAKDPATSKGPAGRMPPS